MSEKDPGIYYTYNSPYFESQADLDAAYPGGAYQFDVNDGADFGNLNEPTNAFYSDSIPYFTGGTWANLQALDPTQREILSGVYPVTPFGGFRYVDGCFTHDHARL